ncbi:uncharacterized protein znf318 [Pholidichthys leucotaenia]
MYRDRPPFRGGYPPSFQGRGPRPFPGPGYRDDRGPPRAPYHPSYHDRGPPDSYRRSSPHRRLPSPCSGSHRGRDSWTEGPPRERPSPPRGPVPVDRNLVITVGNELTGPSSSAPSRHYDRPSYERGRSPDRTRAKSLGQSKSRHRSHSRSPDRGRGRSRPRSQSPSPARGRTKSLGRSKSQHRSSSRSRANSRGRSRSRSPDRSRAKSRGRSRSRSSDLSRAKSRGRSKSRPRSRSRSKSRSRSRSRGRSRGRSYSKARSHARSKSHHRSCSRSSRSSSSSSCSKEKDPKAFSELLSARRRKELEDLLSQPTKSILKKRSNSDDSPSVRSLDSPRSLEGASMSRVAEQLLLAVKSGDPQTVASMLSDLRSDPQMAHRLGLEAEIKEILSLLGEEGPGAKAQEKTVDDIDDEEKFLYGDVEDSKPPSALERHCSLDMYGDVTEESLYGDHPPQKAVAPPVYGWHAAAPAQPTHFQASLPVGSTETRYASQPGVSSVQNITVQVSNTDVPLGTEPLEESDRQALEEYEKLQDLLKTIGLDLGVADISKMAARTKERLQGNKPPPKTPTHRRRYSSDSSDDNCRSNRRRSHSSSNGRSRSHSGDRGEGGAWSSDDEAKKTSAPPKIHDDIKDIKGEMSNVTPPVTQHHPNPTAVPAHPTIPIPSYPPSQVHSMMPPNFPPPGYGQYGNYLAYMPQQWPPMYPPPNMNVPPPPNCAEEYPPTLLYNQPYSTPDADPKGSTKSGAQDGVKGGAKVSCQDKNISEEQNNESQKQKVLEEREKLKQERDIRMKKKEYLMKELERLRKQQGELLRRKRREKDGHKDPLLQEIGRLQEEVMAQISALRVEHEAAEKKRTEIEKVAQILGLAPSNRQRRVAKTPEVREDEAQSPPQKRKKEEERSPDDQQEEVSGAAATKHTSATLSKAIPDKLLTADPVTLPPEPPFEYYDAGNHWCKNCNATCGSMFDFFTHLHSRSHRKTLDPYDRPWASTASKVSKKQPSEEKQTKPAKGSEFLLPVRGFFCLLCREFFGDSICAEEHVTTHAHNEKYKKQMYENPLYEQRRNLDRQAGLKSEASAKKRKHDDNDEKCSKDKEEKSKHKKKDKEKKGNVFQEEEVKDKIKLSKKDSKSIEEERPSCSKKDDEKLKYAKDRYRSSRDDYRRDEEYQSHHRRGEDDRYGDHLKSGSRDEDRHRGGQHSKYDATDQEEGKVKPDKNFRKHESERSEVVKPEPPKSYRLPKFYCGPSPAMVAKLRKQNLESGKLAPTFGTFTWKKKENLLAKEAQKVAEEFLKDDEDVKTVQNDSLAKSLAVAKQIEEKLGGQKIGPRSWVGNHGRIRPNLPAPAAVMRKNPMMGRPASLNTFLSMRPQNPSLVGSSPKELSEVGRPMPIELVQPGLQSFPSTSPPTGSVPGYHPEMPPPTGSVPGLRPVMPPPTGSVPGPRPVKLPPMGSIPDTRPVMPPPAGPTPGPIQAMPPPVVSTPGSDEIKSPPPMSSENKVPPVVPKPAPSESKSTPSQTKSLLLLEINSAPPVSEPATSDVKPIEAKPSQTTTSMPTPKSVPPQPAMIKIVSDVAAPGVPESEQTCTVFVKPPPLKIMTEGAQKSSKVKSTLATAKAQQLFGIFYHSTGQTRPSALAKPITDSKTANESTTSPAEPSPPRIPAPQSQYPAPKTPTEVQTSSPKDLSNEPDLKNSQNLSSLPELKNAQNLNSEPDLSSPPDLKNAQNLSIEPDLSSPPDLKNAQNLSSEPDPSTPPDLKNTQNLSSEPDPSSPPDLKNTQNLSSEPYSSSPPDLKNAQNLSIEPDLSSPPDLKNTQNLSSEPDPSSPPDLKNAQNLSSEPDPSSPPDLKNAQNLSNNPDLSSPLELKNAQNLSNEPDLSSPPDLNNPPDPKNTQNLNNPPDLSSPPASPENQTDSDIQIMSVWSMNSDEPPKIEEPPMVTSQIPHPKLPTTPEPEPQVTKGEKLVESEQKLQARANAKPPQIQTESPFVTEPGQDSKSQSHPDSDTTPAPQQKSKPGPKTRGKTTPKKSPVARLTRQTRSQTRYQTRQQQQQQSEPEPASSGDNNCGVTTTRSSDLSLESQPEALGSEMEDSSQNREISTETLGLPADMTALDFDYHFDFE